VAALAAGLAAPSGGSCLVLHESESDTLRKSLEPLRAAASLRWNAELPQRSEHAAAGAIAGWPPPTSTSIRGWSRPVADACEGDPLGVLQRARESST